LHRRLGRSPSTSELADALNLTSEEVLLAMEAGAAFESTSLDEPRSRVGDSREPAYASSLAREDERFELVEHGATIAPSLGRLGHRERSILHMRFAEDLTQSEIADRMGLSQMHVSRLLRRTLEELRTSLAT
jgi:RNA polymerase sigma-B factor